MNYWKWGAIIAVILLAFWAGCKTQEIKTLKQTGTVVKIDSSRINLVYIPIPYKITKDSIQYKIERKTDTIISFEEGETVYLPSQTPEFVEDVLNDWSSTRYYDTTIGKDGDSVRIFDRVNRNKLMPRQLSFFSTDTVKTITTVKTQPKKFVLSFQLTNIGNIKSPLYGQGVGLNFKFPKEDYFSANILNIPGHRPMYQVTKGWPIRLNLFPKIKN